MNNSSTVDAAAPCATKRDPLFTVKEAAQRLEVAEATVRVYMHKKLLSHVKVGASKRYVRIPQSAIDDFLAKHSIPEYLEIPISEGAQ